MEFQPAFDVVIAISGFLGGFILNAIWGNISDLTTADKLLVDKVNEIEVLVAGQYVKRDDLEKLTVALFTKLDKIDTKLDRKADKI